MGFAPELSTSKISGTLAGVLTLVRGGAGTGKSFALREGLRGLRDGDHEVQVIAPQRQQVIDLQCDGFEHAQTVSEFLTKAEMRSGTVVILDEAGQLGARQMQALLRFIETQLHSIIPI